jgi:RNA polymerase sigma factor (sigma-70 family)
MVTQAPNPLGPRELERGLLESRDRFVGYVRKRVADPVLAEDILQESLLRAIRAAPTLRQQDRLVPWFYTVLQHAIVDAYRRRGVERRHVVPADDLDIPAEPDDEATLCTCFEPLVSTLTPEYAELIRAVELGGESPESAAERLGITPNNLKVRRHRARQALRRRLEETCRACAEHGCLDCTCVRDKTNLAESILQSEV